MNPQKVIFLLFLCMIITGPVTAAGHAEAAEANASCAIYIYMCGSNLESKFGFATQNIDELLEAAKCHWFYGKYADGIFQLSNGKIYC